MILHFYTFTSIQLDSKYKVYHSQNFDEGHSLHIRKDSTVLGQVRLFLFFNRFPLNKSGCLAAEKIIEVTIFNKDKNAKEPPWTFICKLEFMLDQYFKVGHIRKPCK